MDAIHSPPSVSLPTHARVIEAAASLQFHAAIWHCSCRPQTLSRQSGPIFSPRSVVRVTLMRCKIGGEGASERTPSSSFRSIFSSSSLHHPLSAAAAAGTPPNIKRCKAPLRFRHFLLLLRRLNRDVTLKYGAETTEWL